MTERITVSELALEELVARAEALAQSGERRILGICGTPGAGKSTFCAALAAALGDRAAVVAMDGFHLADDELIRLGRRDRKGAPDTFDVDGYAALLRRLRAEAARTVYAPRFDRGLEESIGSAVPVPAAAPLVITEGNYLLLPGEGWDAVRESLDEVWYLDVAPAVRADRLIGRRRRFGDALDAAAAWVHAVDEPNAAVIEATRMHADLVLHLTTVLDGAERS
ncbi:nucleoside/nucleotide kinase family protein [Microbacterium tumbae]